MLPLLARVLDGEEAARALSRWLRQHPSLGAGARAAVAESVFGVALWRRRLAYHAQDTRPAALLFSLLRDLAERPTAEALALSGLDHAPPLRPAPEDLALAASLPDWIAALFVREFGEEAPALADACNQPGPVMLRANTHKVSRAQLLVRLAEEGLPAREGRFAPHAVALCAPRPNIYGSPAHQAGLYEVQDEGSQLLAALLGAVPGEVIVDYCAGAGGKTLALGAALQDRGTLYVHDIDESRLARLSVRADRAGLSCVRRLPPTKIEADAVLVDAPCSELGTLRRGPDTRFRIPEEAVARCAVRQAEIMRQAAQLVRPGGRLVYATCSLARAENEQVVDAFLDAHPRFTRRPLPGWLDASFQRGPYFAALPHRHHTDGFFAALLGA